MDYVQLKYNWSDGRINHIGINNPAWKDTNKTCCICGKIFHLAQSHLRRRKTCSVSCMGELYKKKFLLNNNHNWKGGKSFEPYPLGWSRTYKEQIRFRDRYKCQICGIPEIESRRKLDVHHKDYDKNNIKQDNLVSLCLSCHRKTNGKRDYWKGFFNARISP